MKPRGRATFITTALVRGYERLQWRLGPDGCFVRFSGGSGMTPGQSPSGFALVSTFPIPLHGLAVIPIYA